VDVPTAVANGLCDVEVQVSFVTWSDMVLYNEWLDSSQECNALKLDCMNKVT